MPTSITHRHKTGHWTTELLYLRQQPEHPKLWFAGNARQQPAQPYPWNTPITSTPDSTNQFNSQWTLSALPQQNNTTRCKITEMAVYPTSSWTTCRLPRTFSSCSVLTRLIPITGHWVAPPATWTVTTKVWAIPFLRPYTDYNVDLTYILKSKYIFQASYSYTPDYFMQTVYLDSDRLKAIYNWQNWDYAQDLWAILPFQGSGEAGGTAVSPHRLPCKHDKASVYYDAPFNQKQWVGVGHWTHTFQYASPTWKWRLPLLDKQKIHTKAVTWHSASSLRRCSLRYTFAKDKAMLQLKGRDLFNTMNPKKSPERCATSRHEHQEATCRALPFRSATALAATKKKKVKEVELPHLVLGTDIKQKISCCQPTYYFLGYLNFSF